MKKINLMTTGLYTMCTESFKMHNIDYYWIINNPSAVLWADNILLTKYVEESIFEMNKSPLDKSLNLIFELLKDQGIVKFKNSENIFNDKFSEELDKKIEEDLSVLQDEKNSKIRIEEHNCNNPQNIFINDKSYCFPELRSIYVSLIISEKWDAQCLFSEKSLNFLKYKLNLPNTQELQSPSTAFNNIFNLHLPDLPILSNYPISERCKICVNEKNVVLNI